MTTSAPRPGITAWSSRTATRRASRLDLTSERGRALVARARRSRPTSWSPTGRWSRSEKRASTTSRSPRGNPGLIYARGSGFGPEGPDRDLPALDELAAARTGMMPILPQPGQPPVYPGHGQMYTAVMLAFGVLTALHHRRQTGEGQQVDTSLLAGNMYGASLDLQAFLAIGGERFLQPISRLDAGNPMSGTMYMSADGLWVTLTMPDTDRWWPAFAPLVDLDVADPALRQPREALRGEPARDDAGSRERLPPPSRRALARASSTSTSSRPT